MARIRTFVAVDLADGVKDRLVAVQEKLGQSGAGVKWVPRENLHLTLLFLGEVEQLDVVQICREVRTRSQKHGPFTLEVAGLGAFPNSRRPKILWAGLTDGCPSCRTCTPTWRRGCSTSAATGGRTANTRPT